MMPTARSRKLNLELNEMEHRFFFERMVGTASAEGYIGNSTFRGWRSYPKRDGIVKKALEDAFHSVIAAFQSFIQRHPNPTREQFDDFHDLQVDKLYGFLRPYLRKPRVLVFPAAKGSYPSADKYAYNTYAKVIDLAYSHWCFRPHPTSGKVEHVGNSSLRHCLHVSLDSKVLDAIRCMVAEYSSQLTPIQVPDGGMGSVKSRIDYYRIQHWIRSVVDIESSTTFIGHTIAPLAFDVY